MAESEKKPSPKFPFLGEKGYTETKNLAKELGKDEYFEKLGGVGREERQAIGKILANEELFGEFIEEDDILKINSLIRELKDPSSSDDSRIRKIGEEIRKKLGPHKTNTLADILQEKFFGKK